MAKLLKSKQLANLREAKDPSLMINVDTAANLDTGRPGITNRKK